MEGTAQIRIASRSVFGGVEGVIRRRIVHHDIGVSAGRDAALAGIETVQLGGVLTALFLMGGHGVKRLRVRRRHRHADQDPPGQPHPERESQGGQLGPDRAKGWLGDSGVYAAGWHAACECAAGQPVSEKIAGEKTSFFLSKGPKSAARIISAQNAEIPHRQPERYFLSCTGRERK